MGKTGFVMEFCACRNPRILHLFPEDKCDLKEQIPQDLQFELEMQLNEINCVKQLFNIVSEVAPPRERAKSVKVPTPQGQTYEPKRTALPKFSVNALESWIKNVQDWNERYESSFPLDKYFDLIKCLQDSDDGVELAERLNLENFNTKQATVIEQCLVKLKEYLQVNVFTRANDVCVEWIKFKRESNEKMSDYLARGRKLRQKRAEAKIPIDEKSYTFELIHRAGLNNQNLTMVQNRLKFDSPNILSETENALSLITAPPH